MPHFPNSESEHKDLCSRAYHNVRVKDNGKDHTVFDGAPCEWSEALGATHTLFCGDGPGRGTRPARMLKTVLHVGVNDTEDGQGIIWEAWDLTPSRTVSWPASPPLPVIYHPIS